jgi:hypothetical protein
MEGEGATERLRLLKKGRGGMHGVSHDDGEVAAGQSLGRGGATWSARAKAKGEELERRLAWRQRVGATRVENGASRAAATVSCGGDGKQLLAARAAAWRARGRLAGWRGGGGRARGRCVGVRGGRWRSRAARHDGLRWRCGAAEGKQRRKKKVGGGRQGLSCEL